MFGSPSKPLPHTASRISDFASVIVGVPHQVLEQGELSRRERHVAPEAHDASTQRVEFDGTDLERLGSSAFVTAQEGVDPGHQDRVLERLVEVVVGADVEPFDLVELAVLGGQDHQRRVDAGRAKVLADAETVSLGQHEVQHDEVVLTGPSFGQARLTVVAPFYVEPLILEEVTERPGQVVVVLDDQYTAAFTHCR